MKLTLKYRWRPRPFRSFLGFMDLKTGVTIALLFALLNKVAGVYGLIAVFTGGSLAQLSLYVYSIATLVAFAWGLRAITAEDPKRTLYFAHIFFVDHLVSTTWTVFFGVLWWVYNPHDGKRQANSKAQQDLMALAGNVTIPLTDDERAEAAMRIWNKEKGFAMTLLVVGWLAKIYFALLIYSYAVHLRKGTYRSLPLTISAAPRRHGLHGQWESTDGSEPLHEDEPDDFSSLRTPNANKYFGQGEEVDEVLFDEDERTGDRTPGGFHSRLGTEESASASSGDVEDAAAPRR